jgi:hypothetical protein
MWRELLTVDTLTDVTRVTLDIPFVLDYMHSIKMFIWAPYDV